MTSRTGGPADARIARRGRWRLVGDGLKMLEIEWSDTSQRVLLEVNACSDDVLQLKVVDGGTEW